MNIQRTILAVGLSLLAGWVNLSAAAPEPRVVVTLKPIHSLVAGVMEGIAEPALLLTGGESPHDYSLRPSDVRLISQAQVVFWVGENLETFLAKPLTNATETQNVALAKIPDLTLLPLREGGLWEAHEHGEDHQDGHHHDNPAEHADGDLNMHIWLDPHNAMTIVRTIGATLETVDPAHQELYRQNTAALLERLQALDQELQTQLAPVRNKPYLVFHDAYPYFEQRYGLNVAGSLTVSPEHKPGARRVQEIRDRIRDNQIQCVFSEPQFESALVNTLLEDTPAKRGVLDPLGTDLTAGADAYFQLLRNLATSLQGCLGS